MELSEWASIDGKNVHLFIERKDFDPDDWLHFVQGRTFESSWKQLGLSDDDLRALEMFIMLNPQGPPVISGTGGLRKVRFAPESWNVGKSGAARVCYVYFPEFSMVFLVLAFGKGEKENLTANEKREIKTFIGNLERLLRRQGGRL